jgi:hypothetical protein
MALTLTSLTHPTMIAKIRAALYYASKGEGDKMNGHGNRCYIQNAKGNNIMRLNWLGGKDGYIVYGHESRDITSTVRAALQIARDADRKRILDITTLEEPTAPVGLLAFCAVALLLTGCQASGSMTVVFNVLGSLIS